MTLNQWEGGWAGAETELMRLGEGMGDGMGKVRWDAGE